VILSYLIDTNIAIALLKGRGGEATIRRFEDAEGRIGISCVSVMELEYGLANPGTPAGKRRQLDDFLGLLAILAWDQAAAVHAGQIRAALARRGTSIGPYDALIAGHARSLGLTVVTNNRKEFDRVPGLLVEDWLEAGSSAHA